MNLRSVTSALRPPQQRSRRRSALNVEHTQAFLDKLFGQDMHAARVASLANGVVGVLTAAVVSIHAIGQAYAAVAKITAKSGIKQVDRLLSNPLLDVEQVQKSWVKFVVGVRKQIVIAMDWTEFDDDDHSTLCAYLVTSHGRATPLVWQTVQKSELLGRRTGIEHAMIERMHRWLDADIEVELLADRGFGDQKLYKLLTLYGWDFNIRFRGNIRVENADGEARPANEWLLPTGRARMLRGARVTADRTEVAAVVVVHARGMKEPWCLVTSRADFSASQVVKRYGRRFTIEETFRDTKDLHFGMGLKATHIRNAARRDRLLLLVAMAHALLTLLGAASEAAGLDRYLKANTVKRRTHSLYRQGCYWYMCLPTMREEWLRPLMGAFDRIVQEHAVFHETFGVI
jgi:hypothetical protein